MNEIELKFLIGESEARRLRTRIKALQGLESPLAMRKLHSVYFDTADGDLRRAGIALRLRRDGRRWIQTVKAKTTNIGAMQSGLEAECPAPGGRLHLDRIPDIALRSQIIDLTAGHPLTPVCETNIRRTLGTVALNGHAKAELAIDLGAISAGEATQEFRELEIELKQGSVGALFDLTRQLFPEGGLNFSRMSKAARGFLLAREGRIVRPMAPRNAATVPLSADQSAETAARDVLRECFDQVAHNVEVVRALDDPEGPHQLRVGLRRLRSAFLVFGDTICHPELTRLGDEARWLGQKVGGQRDLDVAIVDLLEPEARAHPQESGFGILSGMLRTRADAHRGELRKVLESARTQNFLIDLARFIEARGWLQADDFEQTQRLARPVGDLARDAIGQLWKRTRKRARDIEALDIEARHELRKELKKLRYAIEFFSPVLPAKRVGPFIRRLKDLQQVFGDLNDAAMAAHLLTGLDAPGAGDPDAQRAVGWLLGTRTERADHHWLDAKALWDALRSTKPCW
ncbi:MAG: CHAD domain-containing protein [Rhodobacteraceae bacterium]|nr:CHAD domain-containing protein [Paracoccaceae bacterium]